MQTINADTMLMLSSTLATRKEENCKYVVYNPGTDELHVLSRLAYILLKLCEKPARVTEITELVEEAIPSLHCDQGHMEVMKLLQKLLKRGLLQTS
ncbi:PqqD family protein [Saccharibacillus sp. CPCC 101409]|uniref:PqqD family protein n=1 Tax=Saccharibacillus sp. CPCC 101409 TaxID=3058041 RepID=UPI002672FB25|nr:PqqD family protein [Saccharibacillus sp. CPCC 101409]MDO3409719.1 PqqD family protein [Saccharibacillus sp. CPCC 101409]